MSQPPFGFSPHGGGGGTSVIDASGNALADNEVVRGSSATGIQGSDVLIEDISGGSVTVHTSAGTALVVEVTEPAAAAGASVAGDTLTINAGDAVASTDTAGAAAGGALVLTAGAAARFTSGNANGGAVNLTGGAGIGTGVQGSIVMNSGFTVEGASGGIQRVMVAGNAMDVGTSTGNNLRLMSNNTARWNVNSSNGNLENSAGNAGEVSIGWAAASSTVPVYTFIGDTNAGVGRAGADQISLIANGAEIARASAAVSGQSDGLTSTLAVDVEITSPVTVVGAASDSGKVITNEGAAGSVTYNLPSAAAGLHYIFIVHTAQPMVVDAAAGDVIQIGGSVSSSGGTATNGTVGSALHIVAIDGTSWTAISSTGTWTLA